MSKTFTSRHLNETLKRCKNGAHEPKSGHHTKRAIQAEEFRKEVRNSRRIRDY
jgi:hypothetical protein